MKPKKCTTLISNVRHISFDSFYSIRDSLSFVDRRLVRIVGSYHCPNYFSRIGLVDIGITFYIAPFVEEKIQSQ